MATMMKTPEHDLRNYISEISRALTFGWALLSHWELRKGEEE